MKSPVPVAGAMMSIADHVTTLKNNENLIVVQTIPGSAHYVGSYIDRRQNPEVLGTVAGDDTIMVIPSSTKQISHSVKTLKGLLGFDS